MLTYSDVAFLEDVIDKWIDEQNFEYQTWGEPDAEELHELVQQADAVVAKLRQMTGEKEAA